jgi:small subunit ribosomal protein S9
MPEAAEPTVNKTPTPESPAPAERSSLGPPKDLPAGQSYYLGTGRRKTAVARVRVRPGKGEFRVNGRPFAEFFHIEKDRRAVGRVLDLTDTRQRVDVFVNIFGGGTTGQAGAIVLGLARALHKSNPAFEPVLRDSGFLTRDSRKVERKKYGQAGARRRFQFSKR